MKKKIKTFFREFYSIIIKPEMVILPGQLAFYFVLAIVPTISLLTYGATLLNLSSDFIKNFLTHAFSSDLANMLLSSNIASSNSNGINFFLVLLVAYYISSNGASSIIITSNAIYGIKSNGFFRRRLKSFIMTFMMLFLLVFILIVPVFGNTIIDLIKYMNLGNGISNNIIWVINFLQSPINWFIIFLLIKLIYTMAPDRKVESRNTNFGAIFTTFGWIVGTSIYSFYINNIANYGAFYGDIANIVIIMLWFYYLALIFTVGMALNYHKEEEENEKTEALKIVNDK